MRIRLIPVLTAALLAVATPPALADERFSLPADPKWKAECGSCHVAYPPQLLAAESWARVMARLDRHYGTDASLDPGSSADIGRLLARHAGRRGAPPGEEPRITASAWFRREHRKVPGALWSSAPVKSPANCTACHTRAEDGDYSERGVRLPLTQ
jgi:hypothetical protein